MRTQTASPDLGSFSFRVPLTDTYRSEEATYLPEKCMFILKLNNLEDNNSPIRICNDSLNKMSHANYIQDIALV